MNIVGVSSRGQSSLFSLATAGQMMSSADYHRPERSSSIGSTVEESESSEGTFPQSNKLPPIHRPASSSSSSSVQQFVNFKNNYTNLSNLTNRVVARPSIADTEECPLLPISMIKRVCESMLENISKKIRVVEDSTQNGSESYVFVDSESGQAVSMTRAVISTFCDTIKQELSDPDAIEACSCDAISSESKLSFNNYSGSNLPYPAQMSSTYGFYGGFGSQSDSRDLYLNSMGLQQPDQQDSLLAGAEYSKPITLSQVSNDERTMGGSVTSEDFFQYGLSQSLSQSQSYARTGAESCVIDLTSQSPPSFAPSSSSSSQSSSDGKSTSEPENSSEELSTVEKESMRDSTGDSVEDSARDSARSMLAHSPTTFATDSADETAGTKDTLKSKFPPSSSIQFGEGTHVMPI